MKAHCFFSRLIVCTIDGYASMESRIPFPGYAKGGCQNARNVMYSHIQVEFLLASHVLPQAYDRQKSQNESPREEQFNSLQRKVVLVHGLISIPNVLKEQCWFLPRLMLRTRAAAT
jgi:hypothetical protein